MDRKTIMLVVTRDCNLSCYYCYEHNKTETKMSFDTARQILEDELTKEDEYSEVVIDFFGGEPFLNFELIREVFSFVAGRKWERKILFSTSTNGTVLSAEIKEWLRGRKRFFHVGLSIDGNKEMHDRNRSRSFDHIDLPFFVDNWPHQPAKMTISPLTVSDLAKGTIFLHRNGFKVNNNLAYGFDWSEKTLLYALSENLNELSSFYQQNPQIEPCKMMSMNVGRCMTNVSDHSQKWCGCGKHLAAYDTDGSRYPCQMFLPDAPDPRVASQVAAIPFHDDATFQDEKCRECIILPVCPTCCGFNYNGSGNVALRDKRLCAAVKLIALWNAKHQFSRIITHGHGSDMDENAKFRLLKGIQKLQALADDNDLAI